MTKHDVLQAIPKIPAVDYKSRLHLPNQWYGERASEVESFGLDLERMAHALKLTIEYSHDRALSYGARAVYLREERRIIVTDLADPLMTCWFLAHELGHASLTAKVSKGVYGEAIVDLAAAMMLRQVKAVSQDGCLNITIGYLKCRFQPDNLRFVVEKVWEKSNNLAFLLTSLL